MAEKTNPFDQFDEPKPNPFDQFDAPVSTEPEFTPKPDVEDDESWLNTAANWLAENAEVPGGITGGISGAGGGFLVGGPLGAVIGGIAGGAIGSGSGSLVSDAYKGDDLDYAKAIEEAALSVGIDLVTLGAGKVMKPLWVAGKRNLGLTAKEAVGSLLKELDGVSPAVKDALELLEKHGNIASLTPFQTGIASRWAAFSENLGRTGIVSKGQFESNFNTIKDITRQELDKVVQFSKAGGRIPADDELGRGIMDVLSSARNVLSEEYGKQLGEVGTRLSSKVVSLDPLKKGITDFLKDPDNVDALGNSILDPKTLDIVKNLQGKMGETASASATYLVDFEKALRKEISNANAFGETFNSTVARELGWLDNHMKNVVRGEIRRVDPKAYGLFTSAQNTFSEATNSMFPDINTNFIRKAGKNAYSQLGAMLSSPQSMENASSMLKSLETAYGKLGAKEKLKLPYKTFGSARNEIKRAYVERMIPNAMSETFDVRHYERLSKELEKPNVSKHAKVLMGEDYKSFKKVVNLMSTAAKKPESGLATLFMRSKEYTGLMGVGAAAATGIVDLGTAGAMAGLVLGTPYVMAKVATSPKHINKLIKIHQMGLNGKSPEAIAKVAAVLVNDVMPKDWAKSMLSELPFATMSTNE